MNARLDDYAERQRLEASRRKQRRRSGFGWNARQDKVHGKPCRVCNRYPSEYHHIVPRADFGQRDESVKDHANAMPLCRDCHQNHHTSATHRVRRHYMTLDEVAFALHRKGHAWLDLWYPTRR